MFTSNNKLVIWNKKLFTSNKRFFTSNKNLRAIGYYYIICQLYVLNEHMTSQAFIIIYKCVTVIDNPVVVIIIFFNFIFWEHQQTFVISTKRYGLMVYSQLVIRTIYFQLYMFLPTYFPRSLQRVSC